MKKAINLNKVAKPTTADKMKGLVSSMAGKSFESLSASEKDQLLKAIAIGLGLISEGK